MTEPFDVNDFPLFRGSGPMGNIPIHVGGTGARESSRVAVFDVCGTLYDSNTTFDFIDFYFGKKARRGFGLFSGARKNRVIGLVNFLIYKLTGVDLLRRMGVGFFSGEKDADVRRAAGEFAVSFLAFRENRAVMLLLDRLRSTHRIVLMSGSCEPVVSAVARELCAAESYASTLGREEGRLTGAIASDLLGEKAELCLSRFHGAEELIVVTDNKSDLELVRLATKAWIVLNKGDGAFWRRQSLGNMEFIRLYR